MTETTEMTETTLLISLILTTETVEKVENYPIQDYVFLLNGEEIHMIGRRWAAFDFSNAPLPKVGTILSVTQGSAYLNQMAFNSARASDNTTIEVNAWEKALKLFHKNYDPDQEFI